METMSKQIIHNLALEKVCKCNALTSTRQHVTSTKHHSQHQTCTHVPHATTVRLLRLRSHRDQPALCLPAAGDAQPTGARETSVHVASPFFVAHHLHIVA
jgi:hypothetical protein